MNPVILPLVFPAVKKKKQKTTTTTKTKNKQTKKYWKRYAVTRDTKS